MMKKLFILILFSAICCNKPTTTTTSGNRVATQADVDRYGSFVTVGDMIFDTPTKTFPDSINQLRYTTISSKFPGIRENAVLWVDGTKIGRLCEMRFLNGNEITPWHISSATLKPIPGTRIDMIYTHNSYGGFHTLIQGLKNLTIDGESEMYPGLNLKYRKDKARAFIRGTFGISISSIGIYEGFHGLSISVLDGGKFTIQGVEAEHGFSALRFEGGSYDWTLDSVKIRRCYFHDTESENTYIGATHGPPLAKINNLQFYDCILSRSGSEAIQLQHVTGNSFIRNITSFATDAGYLNQFQPNQDTGSQWSIDGGTCTVSNIFIDTWGSHAMNFFGSDAFPAGCDSKAIFKNIGLNDGRAEALYFHNSVKYGMKWYYDSIFIRKPNNEFYINNKVQPPNWLISNNNGTDSITFFNVFHDGSIPKVYQNVSKLRVLRQPTLLAEIPQVEYVNSGFYESSNKIKFWRHYYGAYLSGNDTTAVQVEVGDIMIDRETDHQPVFCKATVKHKAKATRPKNDPTRYIKLTWDSTGVRSDQPMWKRESIQLPYPPDDLRIAHSSFWGKLGIGYIEQPVTCELQDEKIRELQAEIRRLNKLIHGIPFWVWIMFILHAVVILLLLRKCKK
jgi:hypothetical protein